MPSAATRGMPAGEEMPPEQEAPVCEPAKMFPTAVLLLPFQTWLKANDPVTQSLDCSTMLEESCSTVSGW